MKIYLNLLPDDRKKKIKQKKSFRVIMEQEFLLLFPLIIFIAICVNVLLLLKIKNDSIVVSGQKQDSQGQYQELNAYENNIKKVNKNIESIVRVKKEHLSWSNVFLKLESAVPQEVVVSDVATKDYELMIAGKSATRESLMLFKDGLKADSCFSDVNIPLSNLVTKEDVEFQLDLTINRECLINEK